MLNTLGLSYRCTHRYNPRSTQILRVLYIIELNVRHSSQPDNRGLLGAYLKLWNDAERVLRRVAKLPVIQENDNSESEPNPATPSRKRCWENENPSTLNLQRGCSSGRGTEQYPRGITCKIHVHSRR